MSEGFPALSERYVDTATYPPGVAFMDGQYLPMREARISVLDYGFLHSDATYDVAHVWDGAFFRLRAFGPFFPQYRKAPYDDPVCAG